MEPGQPVSDRVRLLMGPRYHVSDFDGLHLNALQLRWFDHWLKDETAAAISGPPFTFQPIGSSHWFHAHHYPLAEATPTRLYLSESGRLSGDSHPDPSVATLDYVARGPVAGRSLEQWSLGMNSCFTGQRGRRIRYDRDNRRLQRSALTYTSEPFTSPRLIAGPITLTVHAAASTTETLWVAHLDDVAPDGASRPLTQGALLGSTPCAGPETHLVPARWHRFATASLQHPLRRAPVVPGEVTRYDVEVFPTAALIAPGHRLRLTLTTCDFPHLVPTKPARRALTGGRYRLHQGGATPSHILVPLADPDAI